VLIIVSLISPRYHDLIIYIRSAYLTLPRMKFVLLRAANIEFLILYNTIIVSSQPRVDAPFLLLRANIEESLILLLSMPHFGCIEYRSFRSHRLIRVDCLNEYTISTSRLRFSHSRPLIPLRPPSSVISFHHCFALDIPSIEAA